MPKRNRRLPLLAALLLIPLASTSPAESPRPNVVFILADDLGWRDLGCYGSTFYQTPHIDALARRGLRFTQAYAASPLCSPTRASILTGLYPARTGITYPECHLPKEVLEKRRQTQAAPRERWLLAESVTRLKTDYFTLAEAFQQAGYATGHFGKWHLGPEPYSPLQHGFDVDIPHTPAPGPLLHGFFHPFPVWKDHGKPGDNLEDLVADEAVKYIEQNKDRPFFLNYWAFEVHSPWQAKPEQIARYQAQARPADLQRNPVYAGMVETLDDAVGRLIAALQRAEILDRTIIVFASDNGPFAFAHPAPVMPPAYTKIPATSVLPLRGGKASVYEGGIRVPLIVVWPGVTPAGRVTDALALSTDFLPTLVDLLRLPVPAGVTFDGVSLRAVLENGSPVRNEVFCHFPHHQDTRPYEQMAAPRSAAPASSLRKGDWKLIRFFADHDDGTDRYELYNLKEDAGETADLAAENPELVRELNAILEARLEDTGAVLPQRNPAFRAAISTKEKKRAVQ